MLQPHGADWLGYLAAILVFCSFYAKTFAMLRLVAITSNLTFIGYAIAKGLYPILALHAVLLPLNCLRLAQLRAMANRPERGGEHARPSDPPALRSRAPQRSCVRSFITRGRIRLP